MLDTLITTLDENFLQSEQQIHMKIRVSWVSNKMNHLSNLFLTLFEFKVLFLGIFVIHE